MSVRLIMCVITGVSSRAQCLKANKEYYQVLVRFS